MYIINSLIQTREVSVRTRYTRLEKIISVSPENVARTQICNIIMVLFITAIGTPNSTESVSHLLINFCARI